MTLRTRRIIYSLFIATFLVCAPLLVLYASGYRYNFKKTTLQKTGVLVIETEPRDIQIILNEKATNIVTPARITQLQPNTYTLKLTKPGYQPWQSTIEIFPNQTTFLQGIQMFRERQVPELIFSDLPSDVSSAPSGRLLAWQNERKLTWYDIKVHTTTSVFLPTLADGALTWSPHDQFILHSSPRGFLNIVNTATQAVDALNRSSMTVASQFDPSLDTTLYWATESGVTRYNLVTKSETQVIRLPNSIGFIPLPNGGIYIAQKVKEQTFIQFYPYDQKLPKKTIARLPSISKIQFKNVEKLDKLLITDTKKSILYIIDLLSEKENKIQTIRNVKTVLLSPDASRLMLLDKNEIKIYALSDTEKEMRDVLVRTMTPITAATWHTSGNAILYATAEGLSAIDLSQADARNTWTLSPTRGISSLMPLNNKEVLLIAPRGKQHNVYRLILQ